MPQNAKAVHETEFVRQFVLIMVRDLGRFVKQRAGHECCARGTFGNIQLGTKRSGSVGSLHPFYSNNARPDPKKKSEKWPVFHRFASVRATIVETSVYP